MPEDLTTVSGIKGVGATEGHPQGGIWKHWQEEWQQEKPCSVLVDTHAHRSKENGIPRKERLPEL